MKKLQVPYPWFGGKSRASSIIWQRFGVVHNYVEPFFGGGAVLLRRPSWSFSRTSTTVETINDLDCFVANFWRCMKTDPNKLASFADWPVNEADLIARHKWLVKRDEFRKQMRADPEFCDYKIGGWWVWGLSQWIGGGWCDEQYFEDVKKPHPGDMKKPHLSGKMGVHRQGAKIPAARPHIRDNGKGVHSPTNMLLYKYFQELHDRMRYVRVCCGDWTRILGPSSLQTDRGKTAVLLDPPYSEKANRTDKIYAQESLSVAHDVREWAIANGDNKNLRICLCGYEGEHDMPKDWESVTWKAQGGYGNMGNIKKGSDQENRHKERLWFSPHCIRNLSKFYQKDNV